jgi:hypothetical protein
MLFLLGVARSNREVAKCTCVLACCDVMVVVCSEVLCVAQLHVHTCSYYLFLDDIHYKA